MAEVNGLSTAFVESRPADAARVLEALSAPETAAFVAALSPQLAAPILKQLTPRYGARVLDHFDGAQAASVIQLVGPQAAAQLIQQMPNQRQMLLLGLLPVGTSVAIRLLIGYPKGTCGVLMDPWPLALAVETQVAEALEETRRFEGELADCLFITNGQRRLVGVVTLEALVRAGPRVPLSAVMIPAEHKISALASASAAAGHDGWETFHVLPVVERDDRLVGALRRRALTNALTASALPAESGLATGVLGAYWQTLSALTEAVVGTLPRISPVATERRKDER